MLDGILYCCRFTVNRGATRSRVNRMRNRKICFCPGLRFRPESHNSSVISICNDYQLDWIFTQRTAKDLLCSLCVSGAVPLLLKFSLQKE